ncbi:HK97 gp10 family phage protein [Terrisporobacter sp.]|uniref:HK97 gp10 family phage protein n=1 Tax=Terrisporobacter sp. TaxID=1965305 RepID=UPI00289F019F|nr:HK97 gp10 family phage protein [Terrisporobacter sp.]
MTNISELEAAISKELELYSKEITQSIKESVDIVAKEVNKEIKRNVTFKERRGKYIKSFKIKKTYENPNKKVKTWYVGNGEHRLSHLLENGHALKNGGRARAYPHIKYGQELAEKRMEELVEKGINNANRR